MMQLAFKKADGNFFSRAIGLLTGGKFCHVELVFSDGMSWSSNYPEGVRFIVQMYGIPGWTMLPVPCTKREEETVRQWCSTKVGTPYDLRGVVLFKNPVIHEDEAKFFCDEACITALQQIGRIMKIDAGEESPNSLYKIWKKFLEDSQRAKT